MSAPARARQKLLVLYLEERNLASSVTAWSVYDGTGDHINQPGDSFAPPYSCGFEALRDGWRLIQAPALCPTCPCGEATLSRLPYGFIFERLEEDTGADGQY
jgi:hypothetical protein